MEGVGLGEVQCRIGGFMKCLVCSCVCEKRQHWWRVRIVPIQGLHHRHSGGQGCDLAAQRRLQLRIAGHRQRALHTGKGAGTAPG